MNVHTQFDLQMELIHVNLELKLLKISQNVQLHMHFVQVQLLNPKQQKCTKTSRTIIKIINVHPSIRHERKKKNV
jgi:hypothetical protein